jgi:hypothetical protein
MATPTGLADCGRPCSSSGGSEGAGFTDRRLRMMIQQATNVVRRVIMTTETMNAIFASVGKCEMPVSVVLLPSGR